MLTLAQVQLGQNKGVAELHSFLETLGELLFSCLFELLRAAYIPWFVASLSNGRLSPSLVTSV